MITLAEQPVIIDHLDRLQRHLELRYPPEWWPFSSDDEYQHPANSIEPNNRAWPNLPPLPKCHISEYQCPTFFSRYGRSLQVVDSAALGYILYKAWDINWNPADGEIDKQKITHRPIKLTYTTQPVAGQNDPDRTFTAEMFLLEMIQLDAWDGMNKDRQFWLLPLVDARYWHLDTDINFAITSSNTWGDVFGEIEGRTSVRDMIWPDSFDPAYGNPDPGFFSGKAMSVSPSADLAAQSVGCRNVLRRYDSGGLFAVQTAAEAISDFDYHWEKITRPPMLGGRLMPGAADPDLALQCKKLSDTWHMPGNVIAKKHTEESGVDSTPGDPVIVSSFFVEHKDKVELPASREAAEALAAKLSDDLALWHTRRFCATWAGVERQVVLLAENGLTNFVSLRYDGSEQVPQLVTHAESFPIDFRPQYNFCQRPDLYVHGNEIGRFEVTSDIAPGGSGTGIIPESHKTDHGHDGTPIEITLNRLKAGHGPGYKDGAIVEAYYQEDDGWFLIDDPGAPMCRFHTVSNSSGKITNRIVSAEIDLVFGSITNPDTGVQFAPGDAIQVHDPDNLFPEIEPNATGVAYWRATEAQTSSEPPPAYNRWEVESCSLPINEIRAKIDECFYHSTQTVQLKFGYDPIDYIRSSYPNVDKPPEWTEGEVTGEYTVTAQNPWEHDAVENTYVIARRISNPQHSEPRNRLTPRPGSSTAAAWEIVKVLDWLARWIKVSKSGAQWNYVDHWEGGDPRVCFESYLPVVCPFDCSCIKDGEHAIACYDPESNEYKIISTRSAVLGEGEMQGFVQNLLFDEECTLDFKWRQHRVFCATDPTWHKTRLTTYPQPVLVAAELVIDGECTNDSCKWVVVADPCEGDGPQYSWDATNSQWVENAPNVDCATLCGDANARKEEPPYQGETDGEYGFGRCVTLRWEPTQICSSGYCTCNCSPPAITASHSVGQTHSCGCSGTAPGSQSQLCFNYQVKTIPVLNCGAGTVTPGSDCIPLTDCE